MKEKAWVPRSRVFNGEERKGLPYEAGLEKFQGKELQKKYKGNEIYGLSGAFENKWIRLVGFLQGSLGNFYNGYVKNN